MDLRKVGFTPPYMGRLVPVGWGEAHLSWRVRMTSIYPIIRKLKSMCCSDRLMPKMNLFAKNSKKAQAR